ncbi:MAG: LptF/LptG family permease [Planctomycetes bacterium]|nr:LptF/LptG family permease [Planctomycetota bacterium]
MWKLHRYYLKEVTASSLLTFTVLYGIVLISTVSRGIKRAEGFGVVAAAKVTFLWAADALPHLLPISLLFATVLTFARASQDREVTAIRAAGVSPRVALAPSLLIGVVFALLCSWVLHQAVPRMHYLKYRVVADSIREVLIHTGMNGDRIAFEGIVVTWERRDAYGHWQGIELLVKRRSHAIDLDVGLWLADEAWIEVVDGERLRAVLRHVRDAAGHNEVQDTVEGVLDIRALSEGTRRDENERDMTSEEIVAEVERGVSRNEVLALHQVNRRTSFALLPLLFAPIGFCIGVMSRARGRVLALVFGMVPVMIFYLADFVGDKLVRVTGDARYAWTPVGVLIALGVPFCWRLLRA